MRLRTMGLCLGTLLLAAPAFAQVHVYEGGVAFLDPHPEASTWVWDIDGDGVYDDCPNGDGCEISAAGLDGPTEMRVRVLIDGAPTFDRVIVDNDWPTFTSEPPSQAHVGGTWRYAPAATDPAGALDPLTFSLVDGTAPEGLAFDGAELVWAPTEADVGEHTITIRASDDDGGFTDQDVDLTVAQDSPPPAPLVATPTRDLCVATTFPPLVVTNAIDPDGDALVYFFQIDSDPAFQSADLEESGPVAEGFGETTWIPTRPLVDGGLYSWRAWASDGLLDSEPSAALFSVCVPDSGDDGGDDSYDNGMPDDYSSERGASSGCGCLPEPADTAAADPGPLALLAFAGLLRRRR